MGPKARLHRILVGFRVSVFELRFYCVRVGFRGSVFELWFSSGRVGSRVGCHGVFKPQFSEPDVATGCILDDGLHRLAE